MSNSLKLYTQNGCGYCDLRKMNLKKWGYTFEEINITSSPEHKQFLKARGHKTVPQLYSEGRHLNKMDTIHFTKQMLEASLDYDTYQGGVENFG